MKLKLCICICWLSSCLVMQVRSHCLRALPQATVDAAENESTVSTRHMWQPRQATGPLADTASCNRPTTLRPATDSNVATSQLKGNATIPTIQAAVAASPAVTLANYVYQCAAKREATPTTDFATTNEQLPLKQMGHEQQMTLPAIFLHLAKSWQWA